MNNRSNGVSCKNLSVVFQINLTYQRKSKLNNIPNVYISISSKSNRYIL